MIVEHLYIHLCIHKYITREGQKKKKINKIKIEPSDIHNKKKYFHIFEWNVI